MLPFPIGLGTLAVLLTLQTLGTTTETLTNGTGRSAIIQDRVTLDYTGTLSDGEVFDSSKGKAPLTVTLGAKATIPGFEQGLFGVKRGERRRMRIPPHLGYEDRSLQGIPPGSTLTFRVTILRIERKGDKTMLEIEEITAGDGPEVVLGDTVEVHYSGMFLNGTKFDSSKDRNQTFRFKTGTGQVIKGFDQAMIGMKKGQVRKVTIPAELGYGARGAGGIIPPNATLVFELELVNFTKA